MRRFFIFLVFIIASVESKACPNISGIYSSDKKVPDIFSMGTTKAYHVESLFIITQNGCESFSVFDKGYVANFDDHLKNDYTRQLDDRTTLVFSTDLLLGTKIYGEYELGNDVLTRVGFGLWGAVWATSNSITIYNYNGFSLKHTQQRLVLSGDSLVIEERHAYGDSQWRWGQWNIISKSDRLGNTLPREVWVDELSTGYKANKASFYFKDGSWRIGRLGPNGISLKDWKSANWSEIYSTLNNLDQSKAYLCEVKSHVIHAKYNLLREPVSPSSMRRDTIYIESISNCTIKN